MAKLKDHVVTARDLAEYADSYSDFGFELKMLRMLRDQGLECDHGGLYEDPVTRKSREFDIRAIARAGDYRVHLAVECKNIGNNFPLAVLCVPRHAKESYHEIAIVSEPDRNTIYSVPAMQSRANVVSIKGDQSRYRQNCPVGKVLAQVGRSTDKNNSLVATDTEIFEKWGQCLASLDDLVSRAYWERSRAIAFAAALPIVVVPDGRLWTIQYDVEGQRQTEAVPVDGCSFFVGKSYTMDQLSGTSITVSHIEIMTASGLRHFVNDTLKGEEAMQSLFPREAIASSIRSRLRR